MYLDLSIRFLDGCFHGRRDGGAPEWPPSPLRVFQSLVAAAALKWRADKDGLPRNVRSALFWLEKQKAPVVVAPVSVTSLGYVLSVPNNAMDLVAAAWSRGNYSESGDADPRTHRTLKTVRQARLQSDDAVHFLWSIEPISGDTGGHIETLCEIARSVVCLGWGVDMVVGHCAIISSEQSNGLPGERWLPSAAATADGLRVPVPGTLEALIGRHEGFLRRFSPSGDFIPPPSLTAYEVFEYRRATDSSARSVATFSLLRLDGSAFRAFSTVRQALTLAGMMRHATKVVADRAGWSETKINTFVLGHYEGEADLEDAPVRKRFAYLPLPSIEARQQGRTPVAGDVRRLMLTSFAENCEAEIAWARRALSGEELKNERTNKSEALLSLIPTKDPVISRYIQPAACWATVTPVVLPGYDDPAHYRRRLKRGTQAPAQKQLLDRLGDRIDGLLRKAIVQAGFSTVLADHAELEWSKVGFWPGTDLADRYGVPDHLKRFPRYHVKIRWRDAKGKIVQIGAPICVGGGRYYGLGLFAALPYGM